MMVVIFNESTQLESKLVKTLRERRLRQRLAYSAIYEQALPRTLGPWAWIFSNNTRAHFTH